MTGGAHDNADCTVVLAVLDTVLRRDSSHTTTDAQLPGGVTVLIHDARYSLGRIPVQLPQSTHLWRTQ